MSWFLKYKEITCFRIAATIFGAAKQTFYATVLEGIHYYNSLHIFCNLNCRSHCTDVHWPYDHFYKYWNPIPLDLRWKGFPEIAPKIYYFY